MRSIKASDYVFFRNAVNIFFPETKAFEFSNGYIAQATRNGPMVFRNNNGMAFLSRKTKENEDPIVIISIVGKKREKLIHALLDALPKRKIIIKNVDADLYQLLRESDFREYKKNEYWDTVSPFDDNTFPQVVVNANEIMTLTGGKLKLLRGECNRFDRRYQTRVKPYTQSQKKMIARLIQKWSIQMQERGWYHQNDLLEAVEMYVDKRSDFYQFCLLNESNETIGFICMSEITKKTMAFNAAIVDLNYRDIHDRTLVEGIRIAHKNGYSFVNLQGCETEKQFKSKLKFNPCELIERTHLIYDG